MDKQVPPYIVATGDDAEDLEFAVRSTIAAGYEPVGGVAVAVVPITDYAGREAHRLTLFQAMVMRTHGHDDAR